jgi:hypothetical protein
VLNVKGPEVHRLAHVIAKDSGESLTEVVIDSSREGYEKLENRKANAMDEPLLFKGNDFFSRTLG